MNLRTFYRLFYRHRIKKASIILKFYIIILLPIKYLINIFYLEKKINLEVYKNNFSELFDKDLNTLSVLLISFLVFLKSILSRFKELFN